MHFLNAILIYPSIIIENYLYYFPESYFYNFRYRFKDYHF